MCLAPKIEKAAAPAPTPAPAQPTAAVAQGEPETYSQDNSSARKGRRALRIDVAAPTASGGSGLNIPV